MAARTKSAFASGGEALADLYEEGTSYCEEKGLQFVPLQEKSADGYPGHFASATIQFRCVPENDPEDKRPIIKTQPNVVIENQQSGK